jgi:hypothetical protein
MTTSERLPAEAELPLGMLSSFLFFLARRPVSQSNSHYLSSRLEGLKSLIPVLARAELPNSVKDTLREIEQTSPALFARRARSLQLRLLAVARGNLALPADFAITDRPPLEALKGVERVRLVFGPSIGIGDEIICFPLPRWFERAGVREVSVLTTYPFIWQRVAGLAGISGYRKHSELLDCLRTPAPENELVVLVDFEKPGLSPMLAHEASLQRYLEISLGSESAAFIDQRDRSARSFRMPSDRLINYYDALDQMARWFGLQPDPRDRFTNGVVARQAQKSGEGLTVFVSPFTSKFDPSPAFWAQLIADLFDSPPDVPVRIRVDAGANRETCQLARSIAQSSAMRVPSGVSVEVASGASGIAPLPLKGVFEELDAAHAVICTDSFVAHAAPLFSCTTLVLAGIELSNWRVPAPTSFYFDASERLSRLVSSLHSVLARVRPTGTRVARPPLAVVHATEALRQASLRLEASLFEQRRLDWDDYQHFLGSYDLATDGLTAWPAEYEALLADVDYQRVFRRSQRGLTDQELQEHLELEVARWVNSNLRKLLNLPIGAAHGSERAR